jgi:RHS repeat-associated protein
MQNSSSFFQGQPRFRNGFNAVYYSPFGVELKGRNLKKNNAKNYRFGFQGMEADDQIKGDGNSYDFGARMYDSRLGRWLSVDQLFYSYPDFSPYVYSANNSIAFVDLDGNGVEPATTTSTTGTWDESSIKTIHDLGSASPQLLGVTFEKKKNSNEYDVKLHFNINYHKLFNGATKNSLLLSHPDLFKEVQAHESSHIDQFFEAAVAKPISVTIFGKTFSGKADEVVQKAMVQLNADVTIYQSAEYKKIDANIQKRIDNKEFTSQSQVDKAIKTEKKNADKRINSFAQKKVAEIQSAVTAGLQKNITDKYDKSKQSDDQIQVIEDDANKRASKKLGGSIPYLSGKKPVKINGKVLNN